MYTHIIRYVSTHSILSQLPDFCTPLSLQYTDLVDAQVNFVDPIEKLTSTNLVLASKTFTWSRASSLNDRLCQAYGSLNVFESGVCQFFESGAEWSMSWFSCFSMEDNWGILRRLQYPPFWDEVIMSQHEVAKAVSGPTVSLRKHQGSLHRCSGGRRTHHHRGRTGHLQEGHGGTHRMLVAPSEVPLKLHKWKNGYNI